MLVRNDQGVSCLIQLKNTCDDRLLDTNLLLNYKARATYQGHCVG